MVGLTRMSGRLLVVSNTPFLPPTAGNRERIRAMLAWLAARGWELHVLLLPDVDVATWDVAGMARAAAHVEVAEPPARSLLARAVARLGRGRAPHDPDAPIDVDAWCPPWFRARVAAVVGSGRFDAILVEYVYLSACLDGLGPRRPFAVIDTHDLMHDRRRTYAAAGVPVQWFHTTRAGEARGLARADLVLAISSEDARVLREMLPRTDVLTVPHAPAAASAPAAGMAPARVLYVGSYNDLNVAGLRWFLDAVWPMVRAAVPEAELVVCGTVAEKLGAVPADVVLRGAVADLAGEYASARVVVNPSPAGTGLPVKTVEALCHGRPVVATPAGSGGLGRGVVTVESAEAFAAAIGRLLGDVEEWARRAADAAAAAARFGPDAVFEPLAARLQAAIRR